MERGLCVFLIHYPVSRASIYASPLYTYHFQLTGVYTEPDYYCLNAVRSSPPRVGFGVPMLPTLPTESLYCTQGTLVAFRGDVSKVNLGIFQKFQRSTKIDRL